MFTEPTLMSQKERNKKDILEIYEKIVLKLVLEQ